MSSPREPEKVPELEQPDRLSVTFLKLADSCMRAGYLYLRYKGGAASHRMVGGSAFHSFAERMMLDLIEHGEKSLYVPQPVDVGGAIVLEAEKDARLGLSETTGAIVDEILRERPEYAPTAREADAVREMAYHLAVGNDVDPESVLGVEQMFRWRSPAGWDVLGKLDLLYTPDRGVLAVRDYKTSFGVPGEGDFVDSTTAFQLRMYGLLAVWGSPVARCGCGTACEACDWTGWVDEREPLGTSRISQLRLEALYPRYLSGSAEDADRRITRRVVKQPDGREWLTIRMLEEFQGDVVRRIDAVTAAFESWEWPAFYGDHCSECPAQQECPLPSTLRRWAGSISSAEQAAEAMELVEALGLQTRATRTEVRNFLKGNGPVRTRRGDEEYALEVKETRQLRQRNGRTDLDGLLSAAVNAATFGEAFDPEEFVRRGTKTELVRRKLGGES